jgi:hypothetical protein
VSLTAQAVIAIVAFFAFALGLAATLKTFGTAAFAVVVTTLLALALILQAVSDNRWPAYAAIALGLLAAVSRFAWRSQATAHRRSSASHPWATRSVLLLTSRSSGLGSRSGCRCAATATPLVTGAYANLGGPKRARR